MEGQLPSTTQFKSNSNLPSPKTVARNFGDIHGLAFFTSLEPVNRVLSEDERIVKVRNHFHETGDLPSRDEVTGWEGVGEMDKGDYEKLLEDAGFDTELSIGTPEEIRREDLSDSSYRKNMVLDSNNLDEIPESSP